MLFRNCNGGLRNRRQDPGYRGSDPGYRDTDPGYRDKDPGYREKEPGYREKEPGYRDQYYDEHRGGWDQGWDHQGDRGNHHEVNNGLSMVCHCH